MFGFGGNKDKDVRLTEKQIQELKKNMSRQERKEFEKRQRQAETDRDWDAMLFSEIFMDD